MNPFRVDLRRAGDVNPLIFERYQGTDVPRSPKSTPFEARSAKSLLSGFPSSLDAGSDLQSRCRLVVVHGDRTGLHAGSDLQPYCRLVVVYAELARFHLSLGLHGSCLFVRKLSSSTRVRVTVTCCRASDTLARQTGNGVRTWNSVSFWKIAKTLVTVSSVIEIFLDGATHAR